MVLRYFDILFPDGNYNVASVTALAAKKSHKWNQDICTTDSLHVIQLLINGFPLRKAILDAFTFNHESKIMLPEWPQCLGFDL